MPLPVLAIFAKRQTFAHGMVVFMSLKSSLAPNWLAQQVLNFAKSHADDPHVPEAVHLVVTAGHLGCTDEATAAFSKSAFQLLHKNYPASDWAKKTPYWSLVFAVSLPMRVLGMGAHEANPHFSNKK